LLTPLSKSGRNPRLRIAALLVIVVITALGFIEAVHVHPAQMDAVHCSVCVVAQSAATPVAFASPDAPLLTSDRPAQLESQPRCTTVLSSVFIRPPPSLA
jgi:hypothetical protein